VARIARRSCEVSSPGSQPTLYWHHDGDLAPYRIFYHLLLHLISLAPVCNRIPYHIPIVVSTGVHTLTALLIVNAISWPFLLARGTYLSLHKTRPLSPRLDFDVGAGPGPDSSLRPLVRSCTFSHLLAGVGVQVGVSSYCCSDCCLSCNRGWGFGCFKRAYAYAWLQTNDMVYSGTQERVCIDAQYSAKILDTDLTVSAATNI